MPGFDKVEKQFSSLSIDGLNLVRSNNLHDEQFVSEHCTIIIVRWQ